MRVLGWTRLVHLKKGVSSAPKEDGGMAESSGIVDEVRTRTVQRQLKLFPPLTQAANHQAAKVFTDVNGTLPGFRTAITLGVSAWRFHLHFWRKDKQAGGHGLDYRLRVGKVQICAVHDLRVELPTTAECLKTNFEDQSRRPRDKRGPVRNWGFSD